MLPLHSQSQQVKQLKVGLKGPTLKKQKMNKTEIKDFKQFLKERNVFLMFSQNYRQNNRRSADVQQG